jgi:pyruvate dehydrogenase E1 component alpha subunit/2-oxoisovalerate dehydrogenase E1 component alpha subunit
MVQSVPAAGTLPAVSSWRDAYLEAYRVMLLTRVLEDKLAGLYRAGKIHGGVYLGRGQEALSVAGALALRPGDVYAPLIRDQAGRLAFGETIFDALRTYLGSALSPTRGRDGNVHRGDPRAGRPTMISHLGAMIAVVNGMLLARRLKGVTGTVGLTTCGDGATSTGAFHEAVNQAAVEKLPLVLVVANNQYAYSTPSARQFACASLLDRAPGYGFAGHAVDGTDLAACLQVLRLAVERARSGAGPQMVVAQLLRLGGHGEHDDASYVDAELRRQPVGRDCLKVSEEFIRQQGWADAATLAEWRHHAAQTVEAAVVQVQHEPAPDPFRESWCALSARHLCEGHE